MGTSTILRRQRRTLVALAALALSAPAVHAQSDTPRRADVVVSATRVLTPITQIGSSISVVTAEQIAASKVTRAIDVLRLIPGVAVGETGGRGRQADVRIRGAEANQTLVLIDGIEVNDPIGSSQYDFAHLVADNIERIEILRGAQSALYGSDAVGGVVNIITKSGANKREAEASLAGGSFRTTQGSFGVRGQSGKVHASLFAATLSTDGTPAAAEARDNPEHDGYDNQTVSARLGFVPRPELEVEVVGHYIEARAETDGFTNVAVDDSSRTDTWERMGRVKAHLTLFNGGWEQELGAGINDKVSNTLGNLGAFSANSEGQKSKFDYISTFRTDTDAVVDAGHTLTLGVEREREIGRFLSLFSNVDRTVRTDGIFGHYTLALADRVFLGAGARTDQSDFFPDADTHRFTGAYVHHETGTKIKGSYGTGFKAPTLFELFGFAPTFTGNPNLQPEESVSWDAGFEQSLWDERVHLDIVYFNQDIENLIQGLGPTAVNVNSSLVEGVEASVRIVPTMYLDVLASYTFTNAKDELTGANLVRRPKHSASLAANYRFAEDRGNVYAAVRHVGERDDSAFDPLFNVSQVRLDPYTVVDVAGSLRIHPMVEIFGRIENLFDEDYTEVFTFGAPGFGAFVGVKVHN